MDLYEAMRTTFAAREYTDDDLPDELLHEWIDNARFAPSGGRRPASDRLACVALPLPRARVRRARVSFCRALRYNAASCLR